MTIFYLNFCRNEIKSTQIEICGASTRTKAKFHRSWNDSNEGIAENIF